jgi:hypothetical protein
MDGPRVSPKMHLNHIDQNRPITPHINSYDIFIHVRNICSMSQYFDVFRILA